MLQEWKHLGFVHWRYDAEVVQALLPHGLTVDVFGGHAWVGLIGFSMQNVRTTGGHGAGYLSNFPEINVRTYVIDPDGRRDVWFFSLDINRYAPVLVAQKLFGLPYRWGKCSVTKSGESWVYEARRRSPKRERTRFAITPGAAIASGEETSLELFLTARWGMSTSWRGRLYHGSVDHPAWPLQRASLTELDDGLVVAAGLPAPSTEPLVHYSDGVPVKIGRLRCSG